MRLCSLLAPATRTGCCHLQRHAAERSLVQGVWYSLFASRRSCEEKLSATTMSAPKMNVNAK
jgi:hypothetical protein